MKNPRLRNAVADEIGIDQSGAARLIKDAVDAGYLEDRGHPVRWPQARNHGHTHFRRTQAVSAIGSAKTSPNSRGLVSA